MKNEERKMAMDGTGAAGAAPHSPFSILHSPLSLDPVSRRRFLALMGASAAFAGLAGCGDQSDSGELVPYARQPDAMVLGKALHFATAMPWNGYARGVVATSREGRPTKIEGNPRHPASLGGTDAIAQASILELYDPDRSHSVVNIQNATNWTAFLTAFSARMQMHRADGGEGLRILTETVTSPTLAQQLADVKAQFPASRLHVYQPVNSDAEMAWSMEAFGRPVSAVYHLDQADVVLSLDSDFLLTEPDSVRLAREFADRRRVRMGAKGPELETSRGSVPADGALMSRLYVVESTMTVTGAMADHRLAVKPSEVEPIARAIAQQLGVEAGAKVADRQKWIAAVVAGLNAHAGRAVVIAGQGQPAAVHAIAHALNASLGAIGKTVTYIDAAEVQPADAQGKSIAQAESLRLLVADMKAGKVKTLVILGSNPVHNAPADLSFPAAMDKVLFRVHLGLYHDETAFLCHWHIPAAHYLESWGDIRSHDGTISIIQPLIAPLYSGITPHEFLAALLDNPVRAPREIVRAYWQKKLGAGCERAWEMALREGVLRTGEPPSQPAGNGNVRIPPPQHAGGGELEIIFRPDPCIWDGRYANSTWLQELPKPITGLMWDNAAEISPATAKRLGVSSEQVVELSYGGRKIEAPVWIVPGHADDCVTLSLGFGRSRAGSIGTKIGVNAYALRTSDSPSFGKGLEIKPTGKRYALAYRQLPQMVQDEHLRTTQIDGVQMIDQRELVRDVALADFLSEYPPGTGPAPNPPSLYPEPGPGIPAADKATPTDYAWGMIIDTSACMGCGACVAACQAENNIPVVGKSECLNHREMHWIRIDRYYRAEGGDPLANPPLTFQPVTCMQCENAPCEVVCPVAATVHDREGLNDMVYNRCVGTRYCSNNCPYKVRRFNFYLYTEKARGTPQLQMLQNPDVTVRSRGVMEKCSYCVQRINRARIEAKKEDRPIRDGEVVPACAQTCPTQAISFGNLYDKKSRAARLRAQPQNYGLLDELNTRPRTTYLPRLRNPASEQKA